MQTLQSNQLRISSIVGNRAAVEQNNDFWIQKNLILKLHQDAMCYFKDDALVIKIELKSRYWCEKYSAGIIYKNINQFEVYILSHQIPINPDIHVYPNGSLCLWYPPHFPPYYKICLATDVIVWTVDWINNYELFKVNGGVWESDYVPHSQAA